MIRLFNHYISCQVVILPLIDIGSFAEVAETANRIALWPNSAR